MPSKLKTPCSGHMCPALTHEKFCLKCKPIAGAEKKKERAEAKKFYMSKRWRHLRKIRLQLNPLCNFCNCVAEMVDHVTPIRQGGDPLCFDNTQSLCNRCHNVKRNKERRTIVY